MAIKSMSAEELKKLNDSGEKFVLVDVREQNEWDEAHIPFAQFLPLSQLETRFQELSDKNARLVLQCRSGKRSMNAALFLEEQGYTNLTNLEGGILDWAENGYETTK